VRGSQYTFGDGTVAAGRLELLHRVFAGASVALLARVHELPAVVVDLGPGPGHSTAMLRARFPDARLLAVEQSDAFARQTRARVPSCEVLHGDAVTTAFPRADLIYCRLLLAHLPDVGGAIAAWRSRLSPAGVVVLDEVEHIDSDDSTFRRYEEIVGAMVASRGAAVSAGPAISAALHGDAALRHDDVVQYRVAPDDAAAMFAMNLATWRHDPWVQANVTHDELDALATALTTSPHGPIVWQLHQTIVGRAKDR
jgi:SAM-dependent methyltransferase